MTENIAETEVIENAIVLLLEQLHTQGDYAYYSDDGIIAAMKYAASANIVRLCLNEVKRKDYIIERGRVGINARHIKDVSVDTSFIYAISKHGISEIHKLEIDKISLAEKLNIEFEKSGSTSAAKTVEAEAAATDHDVDLNGQRSRRGPNRNENDWANAKWADKDEENSDTGNHTAALSANTIASEIPASDRIVTIDHNSAAYQLAIEELEAATEAIRGFNEETAYDKEQVGGELEAVKTLLKSVKVRVTAVVTMALTPLYTVYQDVAAESLKPIMLEAINAIRALFGI